ncbi:MAG TPA: hemolysin III family protein [Acidimicrobiales bacterium]|nr:hemolysin III family protein [Acidimicrobiales bacterium]
MTPPTTLEPTPAAPLPADAPAAKVKPRMRGWLHLGAFAVTCVAGPILISEAPTAGATAALVVYVVSIAALFGVSAAFHLIHWSPAARRRMRRADHSTIFVAIAGTYTAVAGLALTGWAQTTILVIVWVGAAAGITLRQVWLDAPKWAVALPYVVVGWCALLVIPQLLHSLGGAGFGLLLAGGAAYTVGALVYARRKPDPWPTVFGYHEVFHLCTVIGAGLHFYVVAHYALPLA